MTQNTYWCGARFPDDIANVFPEAEVIITTDADYRYRAFYPVMWFQCV